MASEQVLDVVVCRHIFTSERPFPDVLDGIFGGISQPDIAPYGDAAASQVAERLDTEVLGLLHQATGVPVSTAS
jgi:hypothetical protein